MEMFTNSNTIPNKCITILKKTLKFEILLFLNLTCMNTGDEFYLMEDKKLLCKVDYDSAKAKGNPGKL